MLNELMKALQESGSSSDDSKAQQSGRARFQENQLVSDDYARKGLRSYEPKHAGCFKIDKRQQEVKEAKGKDEKIIAFKALQEECLSLLASAVYSIHVNLLLHRIINNIAGREARGRLSQEGAGPTSKANGAMKIGEALMQKNMKELIDSTEYFLKEGPERMAAAARKAVKAAAEAVPLLPESTVNAESLSAFFVDVFNRMDQDVWENQKGSSLLPPAQDDEKVKELLDEARDYLDSPQAAKVFRFAVHAAAYRLPAQLATLPGQLGQKAVPLQVSDGSVNLALLFGPCIHLANALLQDADGNGAGETATEATVRSFADHKAISDFCEQIYNQQPLAK